MKHRILLAIVPTGVFALVLLFVCARHRTRESVEAELEVEVDRTTAAKRARWEERGGCDFRPDAGAGERNILVRMSHPGDVPQLCECDDAGCCLCY